MECGGAAMRWDGMPLHLLFFSRFVSPPQLIASNPVPLLNVALSYSFLILNTLLLSSDYCFLACLRASGRLSTYMGWDTNGDVTHASVV